jgi:hypothetical protein
MKVSDLDKPRMLTISHDSGRSLSDIHRGRRWVQFQSGNKFLSLVVANADEGVGPAIAERMAHRHVDPKIVTENGITDVEIDVSFLEQIPVEVRDWTLARFCVVTSKQGEQFSVATYRKYE